MANKTRIQYLMENEEEALRLDLKTDGETVEKQALWAGLSPGMRVADLGCGAGKTTFHLNKLVQPGGKTIGVDFSEQRIIYGKKHYNAPGISYFLRDIRDPLEDLGSFDFIWIRFVLEYYNTGTFAIVKNISKILKPGGILCLIDLDCNCLRYHGFPPRLEKAINGIMESLEKNYGFDPYAGIKLYSYLYDLAFTEIDVDIGSHNLIFGEVKDPDIFNWAKKVEIAARNSGYSFEDYEGGFDEFFKELEIYYRHPRTFFYVPLIACRGKKPVQ
ncbi:MAG: methyltransferase domain-containing protein [Deltaproteobacteria bacterium]|nr:methyltransferase domain-containing protein [Deltaproteobacteria bacterium]